MSAFIQAFGLGADTPITSKEQLGGKGAGLAVMSGLGVPVPPGMTISTDACNEYMAATDKYKYVCQWTYQVMQQLKGIAEQIGYMPLVSVRSGARVSMPGMMDTILNVGLTKATLKDWQKRIGKRAALDSYRRLIQMMGDVAMDIPHEKFAKALEKAKAAEKVTLDQELSENGLSKLITVYRNIVKRATKAEFPDSLEDQLAMAIQAVWKSWNNERAIAYRELNGYSHDWGTAVTVQMMAFGNMNTKSATGVLFTRNPSTGEPGVMGEWLENAQGEDVVAGIRTPHPLKEMEQWNPKVYGKLLNLALDLEAHFKDMQDMEFTVQDGALYLLQTRNGKRSAEAAFRVAHDLVQEGKITMEVARTRVSAKQFALLRKRQVDPKFAIKPDGQGIGASGETVTGVAVFSAESAINCTEPCILIREETTPNDIKGMAAAVGILTRTGGATSHAAVVARGMNKTCVVGCTDLQLCKFGSDVNAQLGGRTIVAGEKVTICGATGRIWLNTDVPILGGTLPAYAEAMVVDQVKDRLLEIEYDLSPKGAKVTYVPKGERVYLDLGKLDAVQADVETVTRTLVGAVREQYTGKVVVNVSAGICGGVADGTLINGLRLHDMYEAKAKAKLQALEGLDGIDLAFGASHQKIVTAAFSVLKE